MWLFKLATIFLSSLGILPFYNARTKKLQKKLLYSLFWIAIDIAAILYAFYTMITCNEDLFLLGPFIVGSILHAVVIYRFTFGKTYMLQSMLDIFHIVDQDLASKQLLRQSIAFAIANATFWPFIVDVVFQPVSHDVPRLLLVLQIWQCYVAIVLPWLIYCLLSAVQIRFSKLNALILDTKADSKSEMIQKIYHMSKLHVKLCDLVDILNDLYGWFFVYCFLACFLCILALNIYLRYLSDFSLATCLRNGIVLVGLLFQESLIAYKSESIAKEGVQFVANSHSSMVQYEKFGQIRNEFRILAQQGKVRAPIVTAAGFLNNNYAMVYILAISVVTYVCSGTTANLEVAKDLVALQETL